MSDTVLGIQYDGGVLIACDQSNARSILLYQTNIDKIKELTSHTMMGVSGPNCDLVNFTEYIEKNLNLYELENDGTKLSTKAQANFCRNTLATALRKGPYQVDVLLGGYDTVKKQAELYFMDHLAALQKVSYNAQGYAAYFCLSIMDRDYIKGLGYDDALEIMNKCIKALHKRFLLSQPNFIIKIVDKDGVRVVSVGADPADT
ncbi:hypothetical protein MPSEU_000102800 [Mayamaea pseudoterrestris]|nr:hypothetical protein MPSEU_000102800 [Mayamaea pseudoterrestris]